MKNIIKNKLTFGLLFVTAFIPAISFAALDGLKDLLVSFQDLLDTSIPVIFGLALIYFFWGLAQFILNDAGNEKTREDGKKKMIWGIVALFVFISIYGILRFIGETLQIEPGANVNDIFKSTQ